MKRIVIFSYRHLFRIFMLTTLVFASCAVDDTNNLDGVGNLRISRDTTWTSSKPILLEGSLNIDGATLIIEAGTTIRMGENGAIVVGEKEAGSLRILGTSAAPVRIIAQSQTIYWKGIHILKAKNDSRISYCELKQAASPNQVALELSEVNFPIDNLKINQNRGDGIEIRKVARDASSNISNLDINTSSGNPLVGDASLLYALGNNITLTSPKGGIYLTSGTLTAERLHFRKFSCPYIIRSEISIDATQLSFDKETRFEFEREGALNLGSSTPTQIKAEQVTFTARTSPQTPGSWRSIIANSSVVGSSSYFRNCQFNAGGGGTEKGNLVLFDVKGIEISNCQFSYSAGHGIVLIDSEIRVNSANHFENNTLGDIKNK